MTMNPHPEQVVCADCGVPVLIQHDGPAGPITSGNVVNEPMEWHPPNIKQIEDRVRVAVLDEVEQEVRGRTWGIDQWDEDVEERIIRLIGEVRDAT